jgi:LysM repeat protein
MKQPILPLFALLMATSSALSASELERLKALCAEQERQIRHLEIKVAELSNTPPPPSNPIVQGNAQEITSATYTVKSGDSIDKIARELGTNVSTLTKLNRMKSDSLIHPGQKLKIPSNTSAEPIAATSSAGNNATHTVVAGDTFYKIASKNGLSVDALLAANPNVKAQALRIGQKIQLGVSQPAVAREAVTPNDVPSIPAPIVNAPAKVEEPRISEKPILIEQEITYAEFAAKHNTSTTRLDEINGYSLEPSTILARGSEIYVPVQP